MLLTRCVLFLAFAINYSSEKVLVNSYISSLLITGLLLIKTVSTKIYRAPWMNILEISFLCNLEVLLVTVCYIKGSTIDDSVICTITNVSVTISLTTFIGIVVYHAYLLMHRTRWYLSCKQAVLSHLPSRQHEIIPTEDDEHEAPKVTLPTTSHVELCEELLSVADDS